MKKARLRQTCGGFPSQWEGWTDKHEPVYIRYRWGHLTVAVGEVDQEIKEMYGENNFLSEDIDSEFDGVLSFKELKEQLEGKLDVIEEEMI
ncbi:hypothetical protein ES705_33647 [subsurface metagenome]